MFKLSPKEDKFFILFVKNAEIAHEASILLQEDASDINGKQGNLKALTVMLSLVFKDSQNSSILN